MPLTNIDGQRLGDSVADKLGVRNLIINGAMQVAQRATSKTSVTSQAYHTVDRFFINFISLGTWTISQESSGPDGFAHSLKLLCTTADASPAAADAALIIYRIEGQDLQQLAYGNSAAKQLTLSFYVKSNKTGNASVSIRQPDASNRLYSAQYTISSANTWERKTIVVPADTSGTINDDNGNGLQLDWWLNSGSNYTGGSHGGWKTADDTSRNASNLGVGGAVNDYFEITGVQLEVGNTATPFEHRSYGEDLTRCQRYFQGIDTRNETAGFYFFGVGMWVSAAKAYCVMSFQTEMRALPTSIDSSAANTFYVNSGSAAINNFTSVALQQQGRNSAIVALDGATGGTNGRVGRWLNNNNNTAYLYFNAEL